ncbi:YbbR-like domain-containing protein [Ichthyenterobacterium magnum]|uniref:YbbR-like protein n=1 Tax=Ichthyenterobacterium magnum TaxID=1230530 RepID=A0A420DLK2_9FLAO|nr:hypothetical protein [Ichthyenterobacterium magnum]RKE95090.1 hypothetical protein BXY80_1273 [Ichthyenterobacterium magnum]
MANRLKIKFIKALKNKKLNVFGVFFLLAFLFLILTKLSKSYTETINFDLNYKNVPENVIITSKEQPTLSVEVSALGFRLMPYFFRKRTFDIDFKKDVYKTKNKYYLTRSKSIQKLKSTFGASIEVISVHPDTIQFPFESLSMKTVPVVLDENISFASGYNSLEDFVIIPDSVKVIGGIDKISEIDFILTEELKIKNLKDSLNQNLKLKPFNENQKIKLSHQSVLVTGNVEKFTEGKLEIPITIINLPSDSKVNYFPKKVTVSYYVSLKNFKTIKPQDFKVVCDYLEISETNNAYFTPKLIKTHNLVKHAKLKHNKIDYILKQ